MVSRYVTNGPVKQEGICILPPPPPHYRMMPPQRQDTFHVVMQQPYVSQPPPNQTGNQGPGIRGMTPTGPPIQASTPPNSDLKVPPKCNSQQDKVGGGSKGKFNNLIEAVSMSVKEDVKPQETENAWKPARFIQEKKKELQLVIEEEDRRIPRKSVGNISFIGELFKQQMLTVNVMLSCLNNLLENKDEESLECLCMLLTTVGKEIDGIKVDIDGIFNIMKEIVDKKFGVTSSQVRYMLQDVIDLRSAKWIPRRQDLNPKTMDQIQKKADTEHLNIQSQQQMYQTQSSQYVAVQPIQPMYCTMPFYGSNAQRPTASLIPPFFPSQTIFPYPQSPQTPQTYMYNPQYIPRPGPPPQVASAPQSWGAPPPTTPLTQSTQPHTIPRNKQGRVKATPIIDPNTGKDKLNEMYEQDDSHPDSGGSSARQTPQPPYIPNKEIQNAFTKQVIMVMSQDKKEELDDHPLLSVLDSYVDNQNIYQTPPQAVLNMSRIDLVQSSKLQVPTKGKVPTEQPKVPTGISNPEPTIENATNPLPPPVAQDNGKLKLRSRDVQKQTQQQSVSAGQRTSPPVVPIPQTQPSKPNNKTNKMRELNMKGANKEGTDMDAFNDNVAPSSDTSNANVTNCSNVSNDTFNANDISTSINDSNKRNESTDLPTIISDIKTLPESKIDITDIVKNVPKPYIAPMEPQDETERVELSNDKLIQPKDEASVKPQIEPNLDVKPSLPYKDDQWSPFNQDGKKIYDRDFLLALRNDPKSRKNPDNLLKVVAQEDRGKIGEISRYPMGIRTIDFVPNFGDLNYSSKSSSQRGVPPKCNSQQDKVGGGSKGKFNNLIEAVSMSVKEDVKPQETENAWKPGRFIQEKKKELQLVMEEEDRRIPRKSVGNISFIGELFKQQMLTVNVMLSCLNNLLENKDEESLECLCMLLTTVGKEIDGIKVDIDGIFNIMKEIVDKKYGRISSQVRFMLQDVIDLRSAEWIPRRQDLNPKTMDQIQKEADTEHLNIQADRGSAGPNTDRKRDKNNPSDNDVWTSGLQSYGFVSREHSLLGKPVYYFTE